MNKKHIISIGLLIGLVGAISWYGIKLAKLLSKIQYEISNLKITSFGLSNSTMKGDLMIKNKGNLKVKIYDIVIDVYANDKYITKIHDTQPFELKDNDTTTVPINLSFNAMGVLSDLDSMMSQGSLDNVRLKFKGKLKVKTLGIPFYIPFKHEDILKNLS
tara:strand:+ start:689 stop:1168 length:480 start_codon:yes stop_codon:yes gene_type:complete